MYVLHLDLIYVFLCFESLIFFLFFLMFAGFVIYVFNVY
jgi:hypothetical protein